MYLPDIWIQESLQRDAILSVAKPAEEDDKAKPSNLIGDHLLAGVPEGPIHVGVPVLLVLHPVLLNCGVGGESLFFTQDFVEIIKLPEGALQSYVF